MKWLRFSPAELLVCTALACVPSAHAAVVSTGFAPTRFTVVDEGKRGAPDVVLIPGLASGRNIWDAEAKLLAPSYRLHLVQLDGFAGQPAGPNASGEILPAVVEQLHEYIEAEHMHPAVIGHSMGGLLALMLADKYPQDVRKMVIVDALPFYALMFAPDATVAGALPYAGKMKQQILTVPLDQWNALQPMLAPQMVNNPEGQKIVAADAAASDRAVVVEAMVEDMETDVRAELPSLKMPTLVMYEYDPTLTQPNADVYEKTMKDSYRTMPNVTLMKFEDSRHFIMYDQPAKFDRALEQFLQ